jgi:Uncharacterized conserved protein (DUF2203)
MKRRRRTRRNRSLRVIRLWSQPEATQAVPYLRSITNSLRDHWLDVQSKRLDVRRLGQTPRPDRKELIALEDAQTAQSKSEDAFNDALGELMGMDVFLLDPVQGLALIPFQQDDELAWYVFDLFDQAGLTSWRYHKDPLDMRRPLPDELKRPRALKAAK